MTKTETEIKIINIFQLTSIHEKCTTEVHFIDICNKKLSTQKLDKVAKSCHNSSC